MMKLCFFYCLRSPSYIPSIEYIFDFTTQGQHCGTPFQLKESKRLEHKRYSIYFLRNESEISLLDAIVLKCNIALVLAMHYVNVMYKCILVFTFMIIYCI